MLRYEVLCFLSGDPTEGIIALGTAGEWFEERFKGKGREYLVDLFLHEVAVDEQMTLSQRPVTEGLVPSQNYAVLFEREADDLVVIQRPAVKDIEPQEPHSPGKPAQHDVSDEFHKNQMRATKARRREDRI